MRERILLLVILIGAMAATVVYASQSQDTRRGAAGTKPVILLAPETKQIKLGGTVAVKLMVDTKGEKLAGVDLRLKYNKEAFEGLEFRPALACGKNQCVKNRQKYLFLKAEEVLINEINQKNGTVTVAGVSMEGTGSRMPVGVVDLGTVIFRSIKRGEAQVAVDTSYKNIVTKYDPQKEDTSLEVDWGKVGKYKVTASSSNCKSWWRMMSGQICQEEERCGSASNGGGKWYKSFEECKKASSFPLDGSSN